MRTVYVKLLQVVWVLSIVIVLVSVFHIGEVYQNNIFYEKVEIYQRLANIAGVWCAILLVVQYLTFASWNPFDLFNNALIEKDTSK
ncbi:hypothetical protein ES754_02630 [Psychrobacter frigidicola]|uniref:Uncharacterized protein n=1 Tax=Psychrobacter frigidicola TaxID=45611 RepID=A0A5C7A838_9GAMM|nr:hypothetical protein [Psychrobacter frigidicola]TXD97876.1 hypothetical protein ES754_02630 [Psychrobacter frigidicola]